MKAVLVIDIPDNINVEECFVDYQVYHNFQDTDYEEILDKENANLRPFLLGEELRKVRGAIKNKNTLIGFNMAIAICNKYLGETE